MTAHTRHSSQPLLTQTGGTIIFFCGVWLKWSGYCLKVFCLARCIFLVLWPQTAGFVESFPLSAFTSLPFRVFLCSFYTQLPGVLVVLNRRTRKKYICSIFPEAGWKILFKYSQIWFIFLLTMHSGCIFSMSIPTLVFCFIITILISVKWYLIVICVCISSWLLILSISPSAY